MVRSHELGSCSCPDQSHSHLLQGIVGDSARVQAGRVVSHGQNQRCTGVVTSTNIQRRVAPHLQQVTTPQTATGELAAIQQTTRVQLEAQHSG